VNNYYLNSVNAIFTITSFPIQALKKSYRQEFAFPKARLFTKGTETEFVDPAIQDNKKTGVRLPALG